MHYPRLSLALVAMLSACQTAANREISSPASAPALATSTSPAATAAGTAPEVAEPGEKPAVRCSAKHPIGELPLSSVNVKDWADAIAGYRPQANGGRPVAWEGDAGRVDAYLEGVHACVHAAFADSFLRSLRGLPKDHPLSDPELGATVELVIEGETGRLVDAGIVASSGVSEFDAAAVAAFGRAFPVEGAPAESLSSDGRLYVTWELRRRPEDACQRTQARPWKLRF